MTIEHMFKYSSSDPPETKVCEGGLQRRWNVQKKLNFNALAIIGLGSFHTQRKSGCGDLNLPVPS